MRPLRHLAQRAASAALAAATAAAIAVACLGTGAARAQSIHGSVLHADSATPAGGIVVVVNDASGGVAGRAMSGSDGRFAIPLSTPGRYDVRFLRVGYRPTVRGALEVTLGALDVGRVVLGNEAVLLAAVTVRSDNVCGSTEDAGRVVASLWEEARTALVATELSVGAGALEAEWQAFQFLSDRDLRRAAEQSVLPRRGATEHPFVSTSADSLFLRGYVVDEMGDRVYRAPDAAALLSNQFAATHCFRVEPPGLERPQWIGVAFRPTLQRGAMRDIAGTLWLDRATSELRLLEFRYTNLPADSDDPAVGGFVEFVHVATGQWFVSRWAIRTPRLAQRSVGAAGVPGGGQQNVVVITGLGVTGGELLRVRQGPTILFDADRAAVATEGSRSAAGARSSACGAAQRPGASLFGTVSEAGRGAGGAVVAAKWRSPGGAAVTLSATTDQKGTFVVRCVAPDAAISVVASRGDTQSEPVDVGVIGRGQRVIAVELPASRRP